MFTITVPANIVLVVIRVCRLHHLCHHQRSITQKWSISQNRTFYVVLIRSMAGRPLENAYRANANGQPQDECSAHSTRIIHCCIRFPRFPRFHRSFDCCLYFQFNQWDFMYLNLTHIRFVDPLKLINGLLFVFNISIIFI